MRINLANHKLKFYIGNVRDPESIAPAMDGVDYVFQAAALKQVPSCEFYPLEAVKTNVLGTENVLNLIPDEPLFWNSCRFRQGVGHLPAEIDTFLQTGCDPPLYDLRGEPAKNRYTKGCIKCHLL